VIAARAARIGFGGRSGQEGARAGGPDVLTRGMHVTADPRLNSFGMAVAQRAHKFAAKAGAQPHVAVELAGSGSRGRARLAGEGRDAACLTRDPAGPCAWTA
jgi:hypothetical protein